MGVGAGPVGGLRAPPGGPRQAPRDRRVEDEQVEEGEDAGEDEARPVGVVEDVGGVEAEGGDLPVPDLPHGRVAAGHHQLQLEELGDGDGGGQEPRRQQEDQEMSAGGEVMEKLIALCAKSVHILVFCTALLRYGTEDPLLKVLIIF